MCKAGANGIDPKADADKQREVAKMLLATQKNLLLINNSRVKMQEELAVANRKIQDLGANSLLTGLLDAAPSASAADLSLFYMRRTRS